MNIKLKDMKTLFRKSKSLILGAISLMAISSCTKEFKAFNTDPSKLTQQQAAGDFQYITGYFPDLQQNIFSTVDYIYQLQQNLNADVYSGFMMSADPFGGPNNTNYFMKDGWNSQAFDLGSLNIMKDWYYVKLKARPQDQHFVAMALLLKVEGMHRITDIYGPIPYSKYNLSQTQLPYDSQQAIYNQFFTELDTVVNVLSAYVKANPGAKPFASVDYEYGGDYKQWLKFANSLRLRLAMRIVYADPATAKLQAEKACADPNGLLSAVTDDASLNMVNGLAYQNPLWNITNAYGDISMGAPMESILKGYSDPRITSYFLPSTAVPGTEKGIRNGIDNSTYSYAGYSLLNVTSTTPLNIMFASESYFLRAEGALRGWNMGGGTAQSFYEAGITLAFQERGLTIPSGYLSNATATAAPYVDTQNGTNSVPAGSPYLNNITIAWNAGDTFEHNLQRIITQKWIAIYPDGEEAWAEQRRTGYPQLMPVVINNSVGNSISTTEFIRRLPFPIDEVNNNAAQVQKAITLLGGPDVGGTKLWWDKNPNH
jgi:hypothetical protein